MEKSNKRRTLLKGITRNEAIDFVARHKRISNPFGKSTVHVTFTVKEVTDFITDSGLKPTDLLRFYLGRNGDNDRTVIIVGAVPDSKLGSIELTRSEDGTDIIGRDFGTLCPPQCHYDDTGSLAFEVFESKKKLRKKAVKK